MNLRQLETFLAIVEHGSFSKAAHAARVTQSTVSQHIAALEEEFGLELLDRSRRGVVPTEAGKLLVHKARRVLAARREAELALQRYRGLEAAPLNVGGSNIPSNYIIPPVLPTLLERFPGLAVTLLVGNSRNTVERLSCDEIELAVVGSRFDLDRLIFSKLGEERIRLVLAPQHRWAERKSIAVGDLAAEPIILRESGSGTGKAVEQGLRRAGIEPRQLRVVARLGSNEAVKSAITRGLGVSLISELSCSGELARGELVSVSVRELELFRSFYLVRRDGRELSPAARAFISVLHAAASALQHFRAPSGRSGRRTTKKPA